MLVHREVTIDGVVLLASTVEAAARRLEPQADHRVIMCSQLPESGRTFLFTTTWNIGRAELFKALRKSWPDGAADMVRIMTLNEIPVDQSGVPNDLMLASYALDIDFKSRDHGWP